MQNEAAPFFIIGSPRSGTTLLRLMLTSHPRVVVPPECGFIVWLHPRFGGWSAKDFSRATSVRQFAEAVSTARKFETWGLSTAEIENSVMGSGAGDYGAACAAIYRLYAVKQGKHIGLLGDKNNFYLHHIGELREIYPRSRFIHIVRDGRDVACSYRDVMASSNQGKYHPRLPTAITDIASQWSRDVANIQDALKGMGDDEKVEIRYEDLTADPRQALSALCDWLGVDFSSKMLHFDVYNKEHGLEPKEMLGWKAKTLLPVDGGSVERYRKTLTADEIRVFESIASIQLNRYGYRT